MTDKMARGIIPHLNNEYLRVRWSFNLGDFVGLAHGLLSF